MGLLTRAGAGFLSHPGHDLYRDVLYGHPPDDGKERLRHHRLPRKTAATRASPVCKAREPQPRARGTAKSGKRRPHRQRTRVPRPPRLRSGGEPSHRRRKTQSKPCKNEKEFKEYFPSEEKRGHPATERGKKEEQARARLRRRRREDPSRGGAHEAGGECETEET